MFFFDVVYLSHSTFYSLWAVVVFPTIVGFPRYILCLHIISVFLSVSFSCIHSRCSVVAERTGDESQHKQVVEKFEMQFHMKDLGELEYFLGIEIIRSESGIYMLQK